MAFFDDLDESFEQEGIVWRVEGMKVTAENRRTGEMVVTPDVQRLLDSKRKDSDGGGALAFLRRASRSFRRHASQAD